MIRDIIIKNNRDRIKISSVNLSSLADIPKNSSPHYQKVKINLGKSGIINVIDIAKSSDIYRKDAWELITQLRAKEGWLYFTLFTDSAEYQKIKANLEDFNSSPSNAYIFGKVEISENLNFENKIEIPYGILIRKEIYDLAGGLSIKFFNLEIALLDFLRKVGELSELLDITMCGFGKVYEDKKEFSDFDFERDYLSLFLRDPFKSISFDKYILKEFLLK